jgi:hypothetical protein
LSIGDIDTYLSKIDNVTLVINTNESILIAQFPYQDSNVIVLGASFTHGIGSELVKNTNKENVITTNLSAAGIISNESLSGVTSLNMLIIDQPSIYRNIDNSTNKALASSIIVASLKRNNSLSTSMNISLYFQVLNEYRPTIEAIYSCSYYDTNNGQWNSSGCTQPQLNSQFNRYECSCNHLSTFALTWSPNITSCDTATQVKWINGTCISKADGQVCHKTFRSFVFCIFSI